MGASYDAAGNLTGDGTTSYTYDALSRLAAQSSTTFDYNADGVLVAQTSGGATTRYTQDLAAPFSQVLQVGATDYVYGAGRIAALGGTSYTWYATDALGSVRGTLDAAGDLHSLVSYDPWGQVERGTAPTFGFTGELQQGDQVYLRARWYHAARGGFGSVDSFAGDSASPASLAPYLYAYNQPTGFTDPSGKYACEAPHASRYLHAMQRAQDYIEFCAEQHQRLDVLFGVSNRTINTGFDGLLQLFTDSDLPGGTSAKSQQLRQTYLSPAAERLEFILWYTAGDPSLIPNFAYDRVVFDDDGFATEFQDHQLLVNSDGTSRAYSNQVNHFLTAIDTAYSFGWSGGWVMSCLIGHEQLDNSYHGYKECLAVPWQSLQAFQKAIDADIAGNYQERECFLRYIVPELADNTIPSKPGDPREGDSIQDLRLSLKGWIFAQSISRNEITTIVQAQTWLKRNIGLK